MDITRLRTVMFEAIEFGNYLERDQSAHIRAAVRNPELPLKTILTEAGRFTNEEIASLEQIEQLFLTKRTNANRLALEMKILRESGHDRETAFKEAANSGSVPAVTTLPEIVALLCKGQVMGSAECAALEASMKQHPQKSVDDHLLELGFVSPLQLESARLGETMIRDGTITMSQFAVAMYDVSTVGISLVDSLGVRGWIGDN